MEIVFRHFWVALLVGAVIHIVRWRRAADGRIQEDPRLRAGYDRLFVGAMIFGCTPWLVMGVGILVGEVDKVHDYLRPAHGNPWVLLWFLVIFALLALWLCWIFLLGGARKLAEHPGLLGSSFNKPWHVKAFVVGSTIASLTAVLIMFGVDMSVDFWSGRTEGGYRTVFVVFDGFWRVVGRALLFIAIGVGTLIGSLIWLRRQRQQAAPVEPKKKWGPRFLFVWSILWLGGCGTAFALNIAGSYELVRAYRDGQAQVAEGAVRVLREQPEGGHAKGDLVEIDGTELVVNYFRVTPSYKQTIAHGGVLREGVHARVWHFDGKILRIDLRDEE